MGASEPALRAGLYGFNSVLTAISLGSVFWVWGRASAACTLATTLATAAAGAVLEPLGLPVPTLPFVLVKGGAVFAGRYVPDLNSARA